jgi:large subunit ribosomal protein L35
MLSAATTENWEYSFMPKLKTHKGAAKRFKKTATGKVKRHHAHLRHMLTSKGQKRKDKLAKSVLVSDADTPKVLRMIPYQ